MKKITFILAAIASINSFACVDSMTTDSLRNLKYKKNIFISTSQGTRKLKITTEKKGSEIYNEIESNLDSNYEILSDVFANENEGAILAARNKNSCQELIITLVNNDASLAVVNYAFFNKVRATLIETGEQISLSSQDPQLD